MRALELRVPPLVQFFIAALAMVAVERTFPAAGFDLPASTWIGGGLVAAGLIMAIAGVVEFRRCSTTVDPRFPQQSSALVTSGVYRFSRNPMYLGFASWLAGLGVMLENWASLLPALAFVACMNRLQIQPEERQLQKTFGERYATYRSRVRRWI
ncbi:MAG: isoprenylcysteine carboxylmethyltransferase family protein [Wenzhouxiangellaceae bacterium]|nr:isoprenylcysteine carboxylmethyltransferase family protein [Wenzhouxiangellaceae bacterium]